MPNIPYLPSYFDSDEPLVHVDDDATNVIDVNEPYVSLNDGHAW